MYRLHKPDPDAEPIKEILARLFTARGWGRRQARRHLEHAWAAAVGAEYVANTRVLGMRRGILEVEVNGATLMHELKNYHQRRLLRALKEQLPSEPPRELRFRAGSWEDV
jgi:predicted nucleic acid-binding Zn ribbon protein